MRRADLDAEPIQYGRDAPLDPALTKDVLRLIRFALLNLIVGLVCWVATIIALNGAAVSFEGEACRAGAAFVGGGLAGCGAFALRASRRAADTARAISGLLLPELP
ncbi:hypothetical protein [Azospirillum sp. sgz302134]